MNEGSIRQLTAQDFEAASELYWTLMGRRIDVGGAQAFQAVLTHPGTSVWGTFQAGSLAAIATLHVLPNMTFEARPYALIENVVTRTDLQGCGFGRQVMEAAISAAWKADAYKIMLLTGKALDAKGFYEKLGFTDTEKHAMTLRRVPTRPDQAAK